MNTPIRTLGLTLSTAVLASSLAMAAGSAKNRTPIAPRTRLAMADSGDMDKKPMAAKKMTSHKKGAAHHRKHKKAMSHKKGAAKKMAAKKGGK
jgi:hypothetical protein